ncbi:MAG: hypothetical protein ACKO90_28090, partial [Microcystis panniformis]
MPSEEQYKGSSLTVFFYHLAQEKIPSDVYKRHKLREDKDYNFGIQVKRDIPWYEPVFKFFDNYSSSNFKGGIPSVIITFVVFSIVFTLGGFFFQRLLNLANLSVPGLSGGSAIIKKGIISFPKTEQSLEQIENDLIKHTTKKDGNKPKKDEIDKAISTILDLNKFGINTLNQPEDNKEKWILSILSYQLDKVTPSNSDDFDGIIDKDGTTYQALKCNLLEHMKLQATQAT